MKGINQAMRRSLWILFLGGMLSCSPIPYIHVHYKIPNETSVLQGKQIFLSIEDARKNIEIIGKGAKEDFYNFSGNISFSVAQGRDKGFQIGVFEAPALMVEAFKRRLIASRMNVIMEKRENEVQLVIVLKDFTLDLVNRMWKVKLAYDAKVVKGSQVLAEQRVAGEAERMKLMGRTQAEEVLGEAFTDIINQLDLARLFQQAGL